MRVSILASLFAILAIASWVGVWIWLPLARRWKLIDAPNARSSHTVPTPRAGGISIVILVLAAIAIEPLIWNVDYRAARVLAATATCIALIGFLDDIRSLGWRIRLIVQLTMAFVGVCGFGTISSFGPLSLGILAIPATVLWITGLTNAYNFMDGLDGIAAIQAFAAAVGFTAIGLFTNDRLVTIASIAIAATAIGFLGHNWAPASVFMGDVASCFLGFVFALLTVRIAQEGPSALIAGALFVWPFLFDTITTFLQRLRRCENVFTAHRSHIYQRLNIAGASHRRVSTVYGILALACTTAGIALERGWSGSGTAAAAAAIGTPVWLWIAVLLAERQPRSGRPHFVERSSSPQSAEARTCSSWRE